MNNTIYNWNKDMTHEKKIFAMSKKNQQLEYIIVSVNQQESWEAQ